MGELEVCRKEAHTVAHMGYFTSDYSSVSHTE